MIGRIPASGTLFDSMGSVCPAKCLCGSGSVNPPALRNGENGLKRGSIHENRHGHYQAFQTRRGPRRPDLDRGAGADCHRGQGLRASNGTHGNLPWGRICCELPAKSQIGSGGALQPGRQGYRRHRGSRQNRPNRRWQDLRLRSGSCRADPHRRNRRGGDLVTRTANNTDRSKTMTLMKSPRAGLLALAFGVVLSLFLSVGVFDASYAQPAPGAAPAAPAAAAPATPAAPPPACANDPDPKKAVLEKCTPNSGHTPWMPTSAP